MNERILELWQQAGGHYDSGNQHTWPQYTIDDPAKFGELIVQECISINRQRQFSDYEGDSHRVAHNNALLCATSDMFEHFGVGE
jgi:hypothetical protein